MRILLGHNRYLQAGGEDVVFRAEADLLREHGHEVHEWVLDNRDLGGVRTAKAVLGSLLPGPGTPGFRRFLRRHPVDVAHFHNIFFSISPRAYQACRAVGIPVVQTLHNYRLICPAAVMFRDGSPCTTCLDRGSPWSGVVHACWQNSRLKTLAVASILSLHRRYGTWRNQVSLYLALTEFARDLFRQAGFAPGRIMVKPNFVRAPPAVREGPGEYALFIGRLTPEKGILTLLSAIKAVPGLPLKIVGDGPLEAQVCARSSGMANVEWLGPRSREEVLALLAGARVVVFPSEWFEGMSMVILEAFSCGVPVLASRLGGMVSLVDAGRTGEFFEPGDAEGLAGKLAWFLDHGVDAGRMGTQAREEYLCRYTPERNYELLMEAYERAAAN